MTFTVTVDGFCAGGEHVLLTIHVEGGGDHPAALTRTELLAAGDDDTPRERILQRLKSAALEAWDGNWVNLKNAIEAGTYKV